MLFFALQFAPLSSIFPLHHFLSHLFVSSLCRPYPAFLQFSTSLASVL